MSAEQKSLFITHHPVASSTHQHLAQEDGANLVPQGKADDLSPRTHILAYISSTGSIPAMPSSPLCVPSIGSVVN